MVFWEVMLGLFGGLGLFLFGMHLMSDSLQKLTLSKLKYLLEKITNNRIKGLFVGIGITSLIQSSSATSVMVIGFVNAGLMSFARAIPIIIGANIGTTVTAQLIAFKLTAIAPLFIGSGAFTFFFAKKQKHKKAGLVLLGFGLLFLGLKTMSGSVGPLSQSPFFNSMFVSFGSNPALGILAGTIMTILLQSSSTTAAMVIALAIAGLIDFRAAIFLILGCNIGTCVTAVIASVNGNISGKKVALSHVIFNVAGTAIALAMLPLYFYIIPLTSTDIVRQIANTHTMFNIVNALIFLPFIPFFAKAVTRLVPGKDYKQRETQYLAKHLLKTPPIAINVLIKELVVTMRITKDMLHKSRICIREFSHKLYKEVTVDENSIDDMQRNMTEYVIGITKTELSPKEARILPNILHSINDIEKLGDYCQAMIDISQELYEDDMKLSKQAKKDLEHMFELLENQMTLAIKSVERDDPNAAHAVISIEQEIDTDIERYRDSHILRLKKGYCVCNSGILFTDILINIGKIADHLNNVAYGVLHSKNHNPKSS